MGKLGLMVERCINPAAMPVLVDLGPLDDKKSRDLADKLMAAGINRKNFSIEGFRRLLVKLPVKKAPEILKRFPRIVEGSTYFQATHHRRDL